MSFERVLRWALVSIAIAGLSAGILAFLAGRSDLANLCWTLATAPVVAGLAISIVRDLLTGRFGVDAIALVSMSGAIVLGQLLAGAVVALMYSGGNVLEDIAVARPSMICAHWSIAHRARPIVASTAASRKCPSALSPWATSFWCTPVKSFRSTAS